MVLHFYFLIFPAVMWVVFWYFSRETYFSFIFLEYFIQSLIIYTINYTGASLGGLIGGIIYHKYKGATLFALLSYVCASAAIVHHFLQRTLKPTPVYNAQPGMYRIY